MTTKLLLFNTDLPWTYRWTRDGRHGQACKIVKRAKDKTCLVEFADGGQMLTDLRSLRRRKKVGNGNAHA